MNTRRRRLSLLASSSTLAAAMALTVACSSRGSGGGGGVDGGSPDAGAVDSGAADAGTPPGDGGGSPDLGGGDDASAGSARLSGVVTRSTGPQAGGVGNLYVGVFTEDPVIARDRAVAVGRAVVEAADMRDATARIPYAVDGIPPRGAPYFVVAFLDDNGTAAASGAPAPDRGDLVTLMGFSSPSVTIASPGEATLDLVLTTALPF